MRLQYRKFVILITVIVLAAFFVFIGVYMNRDNNTNKGDEDDCVETTLQETLETSVTEETIEVTEETEVTEVTIPADSVVDDVTTETTPPTNDVHFYENTVSLGEFRLTAYCSCSKCCGSWASNRPVDENGNEIVYGSSGERLTAGISVAVDTNVIPYGSKLVINGHTYIAHDTGAGVDGNHIDIYFNNHEEALNFGMQYAEVLLVTN